MLGYRMLLELIQAPQTSFEFILLLIGIINVGIGIIELNALYFGIVLLSCYFSIKINNYFIESKFKPRNRNSPPMSEEEYRKYPHNLR